MRFAYADPPYIGQARRFYGQPEVNHVNLISELCRDFPDGWALSCSSTTLRQILMMCPPKVRIGAWVKPFCNFKPGTNPAYAWEPVVWTGGRRRERYEPTVRDWVSANITLKKGLAGAKPVAFCTWLFDLWGVLPGDELEDLFPGTGAVREAWNNYLGWFGGQQKRLSALD